MADDEGPIRELKPAVSKWKGMTFMFVGMGVVIVGIILAITVSTSAPEPQSSMAPLGNSREIAEGATGEGSPEYNERLTAENERRRQQAVASGESFIPTPVGEGKVEPIRPAEAVTVAPAAPEPTTVTTPPPPVYQPEPTPPRAAYVGSDQADHVRTAISGYLLDMQKGWELQPHTRRVAQISEAEGSTPAAQDSMGGVQSPLPAGGATMPPESPPTAVDAGDVLYAVNEFQVNSDVGEHAVARVVAGSLQGAKLLGQFQLRGGYLVLEYDKLVLPAGTVLGVEAVAVDPATKAMGVRSDIDRHLLARWGGFFASSFLGTWGQQLERAGTTQITTTGTGGTTTVTEYPELSTHDINKIATGKLGQEAANALRSTLDRPPTVTLAPNTELGILILSAPSREQQLRETQDSST